MKNRLFIISTLSLYSLILLLSSSQDGKESIVGNSGTRLVAEDFGVFDQPWAMTFLPSGELLITEKTGILYLYNITTQTRRLVAGVPQVAYGGQGGLGDIILHPDFKTNRMVYFSYAEQDSSGKRGAVVSRARLNIISNNAFLSDLSVIWRQIPKVQGAGHYSHRLVFDNEGYLFIASGERQKQSPAQDWRVNLGKIIRLKGDGTIPGDNPFQNRGELAKTFWTIGHRNILGMALDDRGSLWAHEMGPRHGDEFNRIVRGENYGWPIVSWGNHYSGVDIPDHDTRSDFHSPEEYWVPSIAPSGLIIYNGNQFSSWNNHAIIGGLVSRSLVLVKITGNKASEVERFDMKNRIREVEQGPNGAIWILEDGKGARLRRLTSP